MTARHRAPAPDGRFAGISLISANLIGITAIAGALYGADPAEGAPPAPVTTPDRPPADSNGDQALADGTTY